MSTETGPDRPPQRTVAELLAAHGGGQPASGRRRARHDPADADEGNGPRPRHGGGRSAARQADGGQQAWPPARDVSGSDVSASNGAAGAAPAGSAQDWSALAGDDPGWGAPPGSSDRHSNGGRHGGQPARLDRESEPLDRRGYAQLPESPPDWRALDPLSAGPAVAPARQPDARWPPSGSDPRWSAPQPPPVATGADPWLRGAPLAGPPPQQSRRELREAREVRQGQLEGGLPLPGEGYGSEGYGSGQRQAPRAYQSSPTQRANHPPGALFVENPTEQIPRIADREAPNGSNGRRAASAPTVDRPVPPQRTRRTRTADAGPATGAMSPEDLLDDDGGDFGDGARDGANGEVKVLGRSVTDLEEAPPADGGEDELEADGSPKLVSRLSRRRTKPKRRFRLRGKRQADVEEPVLAVGGASAVSAPAEADVGPDVDDLTAGAPAGVGDWPAEDVPAGLSESTELEPEEADAPDDGHEAAAEVSPAKAWLVIIAQLVGGALAGAVLWVGFRYLWGKMPPLALGAAVLATVGSVPLVRAIRRSDDLRTSLFAVLVGLVVTVSPAVLVLVSR